MYRLQFDSTQPETKARYEILYDGLITTRRGFMGPERRVMEGIMDKFEALGEPVERGNSATFALTKKGCVELNEVEFKLVVDSMEYVPWASRVLREVGRTLQWLADTQPENEVGEG